MNTTLFCPLNTEFNKNIDFNYFILFLFVYKCFSFLGRFCDNYINNNERMFININEYYEAFSLINGYYGIIYHNYNTFIVYVVFLLYSHVSDYILNMYISLKLIINFYLDKYDEIIEEIYILFKSMVKVIVYTLMCRVHIDYIELIL